jgi:sn-glycerol 3-phosphate transport system ATP-binding protein
VRPEDWVIDAAGWPMQVDVVELLGAERLVHGQLQNQPYGEPITVRLPASVTPPTLGETLHISVPMEKVHYFDAKTGCRLTVNQHTTSSSPSPRAHNGPDLPAVSSS